MGASNKSVTGKELSFTLTYTVDSRDLEVKETHETRRDIRASAYQSFRIEENTNRTTKFHNEYVIRLDRKLVKVPQ